MSIGISRHEKLYSLQLTVVVDGIGQRLLERVNALLKARPDISKAEFFGAIGRPTPSWRSEFLAGTRTTNDLRLVVRIARFFGVSVGYLLGESDRQLDEGAATLLATWDALKDERDRAMLLQVAASFRQRTNDASTPPSGAADLGADGHTKRERAAPPRARR